MPTEKVPQSKDPEFSRRDIFAMAAMVGLLINPNKDNLTVSGIADEAYFMADAMVAEGRINPEGRKKKP